MELALLTDCYIMISVYDQSDKRVTTFQSHEIDPEFSEITILAHERFKPDDVSAICIFEAGKRALRPQFYFWLSTLLKLVFIFSTTNTSLRTKMSL